MSKKLAQSDKKPRKTKQTLFLGGISSAVVS